MNSAIDPKTKGSNYTNYTRFGPKKQAERRRDGVLICLICVIAVLIAYQPQASGVHVKPSPTNPNKDGIVLLRGIGGSPRLTSLVIDDDHVNDNDKECSDLHPVFSTIQAILLMLAGFICLCQGWWDIQFGPDAYWKRGVIVLLIGLTSIGVGFLRIYVWTLCRFG